MPLRILACMQFRQFYPLGAVIGFPFVWQLFVQYLNWRGPGWITPHISSQETPSEPVRLRQGKHAAEKEKPDVPKEHTETHIDYSKSCIHSRGRLKNDLSEKKKRDICIVLFSLVHINGFHLSGSVFPIQSLLLDLKGFALVV